MAKRRGHRRWLIVLAVIAGIALVVSLSASRVVGYIFEKRLAKALEEKGHARVEFGSVLYAPPYTFYMRNVQVTVPREEGSEAQRFAAGWVSLTLDRFPRHGEPVSIQSLIVHQAMINIGDRPQPIALDRIALSGHQTPDRGAFEGRAMVGDTMAGSISAEGRIDIAAGQAHLEKITGAIRVAPLLARLPLPQRAYPAVDLASPDGKISVSGWATVPLRDIDHADYQLTVDLENASAKLPALKASLSDGKSRIVLRPSAFSPGAVEATVESLNVTSNKGRLSLDGATAILRPREKTWDLSHVVGTVIVGNELPLFLPNSGWFFNEGEFNGPMRFTLAASGPFNLAGKDVCQAIKHEVLAYPRNFSIRPKNFVVPIDHINGGPVSLRGGVVSFQNLTGRYGSDKLLLRNARLILDDPVRRITIADLKTQVKFEEIAGTVIFDRSSPPYPGVVGKTVMQLQPEGPFVVGGGSWYAINRPPRYEPWVKFKPDFYIKLAGDGGSFAVRPYNVPLADIQGQAKIAPMSVEITGFRAKALGGDAWADGQIVPGKPFLYNGKIDVRDADLGAFAQYLPVNDSVKQRLTGTTGLSMHVAGAGKGGPKSPKQSLVADGEWEVFHGDFWSVPAVSNVATKVRKPEELGTADAAGVMHIENNQIALESAAISSPLLGLQGHGIIGFDKSLDLTVVAAPLGDWRDRMKQSGVPLVGDVMGGVQQLLNAAQGTLLFQYKVTGSIGHPEETAIPVPVVTQPVAHLFGQMIRQDGNADLLGEVKKQAPASAPNGERTSTQAQPASAHQPAAKQ